MENAIKRIKEINFVLFYKVNSTSLFACNQTNQKFTISINTSKLTTNIEKRCLAFHHYKQHPVANGIA